MKDHRLVTLAIPVLALLCMATAAGRPAAAQGSRADYERAAALRARTEGTVLRESIDPQWIGEGDRLWYRRDDAGGRADYVLVDCESGAKSPLFEPPAMARALAAATGREIDPDKLPIALVTVEGSLVTVLLDFGVYAVAVDRTSYDAKKVPLHRMTAFHLQPERFVRRSRRGRGPTSVLFANGTDVVLSLFWVDEAGERRPYGSIEPGTVNRQGTHVGHAFVLVDPEGSDRGAFVAARETKVAWVDAETPRPRPTPERGRAFSRRNQDDAEGADLESSVFVRDHNAWMKDPESDEEIALTRDGTETDGYGGRVFLSPDKKKAVVMRTARGDERRVHYVEAAPRDQLQPKLHSYTYPKPGDELPVSKPHLFDLESRREIAIDGALFENPWSIGDVRWAPDGSRFTCLYNRRGHQVLRIVAVDAVTGAVRAVVDETSATFIDYSQKQEIRYLDATNEIVWSSERDGWNHLYLYDALAGRVKNRITAGEWVVRGIDSVDEERRQVWFRAGGLRPGQDPYHVHFARVNLDGTGLLVLTEGDGTHEVTFSPNGRFFVDRYSRVDLPPVTELRRSEDGALVSELERADASALLATGWRPPKRFAAKGRDGATDIWGIVRYPMNHDPSKSYPVIESIYAGPHGAFVPKSFSRHSSQDEIAELGFIVVQIDGMGTNFRSKAFHDVSFKNVGDSGFPDRIAWMRAAAKADPSMDLTRVGIYGGSAGGQSALRALLAHGDFYKAAAADCGCHDNRMDKVWWNEAWMGWPVGPHYEEQSNVTQAHRLEGKLLLTVGAMDENVDPSSTMQVVDALIRADKDFELVVFPSSGHGAGESPYGRRRRADFFVRHLLGIEPRWAGESAGGTSGRF